MNKTLKTILILAAVALILFCMYAFFLKPKAADTSATTGGLITVATEKGGEGSDIVSLLNEMQKIRLDRAVFSTQLFQSLHDFGVDIAPEAYGKPDPFASIGSGGGSAQ